MWKTGYLFKDKKIKKIAIKHLDNLLARNIFKRKSEIYLKDYILDQERKLPYLNDGTAGLLLVLLEIINDKREFKNKYHKILDAAISTNDVFESYMNGLFDGFSGLIVADIAINASGLLGCLDEKIEVFDNYVFDFKNQILTPNAYGYKCSMDLQTGAIGNLLVLSGVKKKDWGLWLPIIKNKNMRLFNV